MLVNMIQSITTPLNIKVRRTSILRKIIYPWDDNEFKEMGGNV